MAHPNSLGRPVQALLGAGVLTLRGRRLTAKIKSSHPPKSSGRLKPPIETLRPKSARLEAVPFQSKVKGVGQECPTHTGNVKGHGRGPHSTTLRAGPRQMNARSPSAGSGQALGFARDDRVGVGCGGIAQSGSSQSARRVRSSESSNVRRNSIKRIPRKVAR